MNVTRVSFIEYPGWTLEFNSSDELQKKKKRNSFSKKKIINTDNSKLVGRNTGVRRNF